MVKTCNIHLRLNKRRLTWTGVDQSLRLQTFSIIQVWYIRLVGVYNGLALNQSNYWDLNYAQKIYIHAYDPWTFVFKFE